MIKRGLSRVREWEKGKYLGWGLLAFFPLYLVLITEVNQTGSFDILKKLFLETPKVLIFDVVFIGILFWFVQILVKRALFSSLITGIVLYILSCVEFYRFRASGAHFTLYDFSLFTNVGDVAKFAKIQIYPIQVILLAALLLYCLAFWVLDTRITLSRKSLISSCSATVCLWLVFFLFPSVSNQVFRLFDVEYGGVNNNFVMAEKFEQNSMLAFLIENATEVIHTSHVKEPQNYSEETIDTLSTAAAVAVEEKPVKPNVITIMSESYADFRVFSDLEVDDSYYQSFDQFGEEGYSGTAVVPTFGGYTIRTEFELLFGLPIKSLNSTASPQKMISGEDQTTIASFYQSQGYQTTYIHPYTQEFYDRGALYPHYGFDNLYFEESFVSARTFRNYVDDSEAFDKAIEQIVSDEEPSYIHVTTMQNHMPYGDDTQSQFDYYMDGIANTNLALEELMEDLKRLDEPTVVLFVGDHFPFFNEEENVYEQLGIDRYNCLELYEQTYFVWSNYNLSYDALGHERVSAFYLPYLVIDAIGLEKSDLINVMMEQLEIDDVYTEEMKPHYQNDILDTLAYDLILGDQYSGYDS